MRPLMGSGRGMVLRLAAAGDVMLRRLTEAAACARISIEVEVMTGASMVYTPVERVLVLVLLPRRDVPRMRGGEPSMDPSRDAGGTEPGKEAEATRGSPGGPGRMQEGWGSEGGEGGKGRRGNGAREEGRGHTGKARGAWQDAARLGFRAEGWGGEGSTCG